MRFGLGFGASRPVLFDLEQGTLLDEPIRDLVTAQVDSVPLQKWRETLLVKDWRESTRPKMARVQDSWYSDIPLDGDFAHALAIRPMDGGFVIGTEWEVRAFDAAGNENIWRTHRLGPGAARGLAFSGDGELLVVAYGDGTIRWLRWSDGAELLALFIEPQSRKWVTWTPSGYYMASAGGEDLIGWHVNRGWTQEADFFPASQFRDEYNRPDIVKLVLKTRDETEAIRLANVAAERKRATPVGSSLPPIVTIKSPTSDGYHFSGETVEIAYEVQSPSGSPVDHIDVLIDGQRTDYQVLAPRGADRIIAVKPPRRRVTLSLIAYTGEASTTGSRTSNPVSVQLIFDGPREDIPDKPKLFGVLVGVTDYSDPVLHAYPLKYPVKDAEGLQDALKAQEGLYYSKVDITILANPTRGKVIDTISMLQNLSADNDVVVIFLSGHGIAPNDAKFYFPTYDTDRNRLHSTAVRGEEVLSDMSDIKGKKVLLIDACNAGAAAGVPSLDMAPNMDKVVNDFTVAASGIVVYAASPGTEESIEGAEWGHGAFTKALIQAIGDGKARQGDDLEINTALLGSYLEKEVPRLTHDAQHAVWNKSSQIPRDFIVARAAK